MSASKERQDRGLSIVLAVQGGGHRLPEVLDTLEPQVDDAVEVLVLWPANQDGVLGVDRPWVRCIPGAPDALAPELWARGIREASYDRVATSIVHCRPPVDWVAALRGADLVQHAGVGGPIAQPPDDGLSWAIWLQRYAGFSPAQVGDEPRPAREIAGDNAVYDRVRLLAVADTWARGFWEMEVHAALRERGETLQLDPALLTEHHNGYGAREFVEQRFQHALRFGSARARAMAPPRRVAYRLASAGSPLVFGGKVARRTLCLDVRRRDRLRAAPWLALFVTAWGAGEAVGSWLELA